jgi:5'-3' exonuclease
MSRPHFLILDASYFVFFRYHAVRRWWQYARREGESARGLECERYIETFKTTFSKRLASLPKLIGHEANDGPLVGIVARDCPSEQGWRRAVWPGYKATRLTDPEAKIHFELVRQYDLFANPVMHAELEYAGLEADDCIALTVQEIRRTKPEALITIVSSDGDFKQLLGPSVRQVDLKGGVEGGQLKPIDSDRELFCRIVSGDVSDNIPGIFPRCGRKTAETLYAAPDRLRAKMVASPLSAGIYARNRLLIDFRCIPEPLAAGFRETCLRVLA